ncbi:MAG: xanthine dehydrogenase family protein molybdopterin-binding subunit [Gammaproteobacteria bacterium]|nr:xanthine dehydrogenase family protein molybdopterin-binding subunit [Gammaproteobacteria bacterium]
MWNVRNMSRRDFLKSTGATTALVLGAHLMPHSLISGAKAAAGSAQPNLFVRIDSDGTVTLTCSRSEMGQGVRTGMPMILADELEADWTRVKIWQAPGDETKYDPAGKDGQNTDGSRSTRHSFEIMRELGAAGRYVLEQAAARKWGVDPGEVYARHHRIYHTPSGKSFDFGEVVDVAADIQVPSGEGAARPKLKDQSQWKYIGKDMAVVDNYDMSTGGADFGADISIPGMKIAVVARPPVYRGKVKSFDATEALKVQGVEQVVEIPALADDKPAEFRALGGVAVVGTNTWSVMEGRKRLGIDWDPGPYTAHESGSYDDNLRHAARKGGKVIRRRGDVDAAFSAAARVVEAEYFVPYFIHTPMEPPVAIVDANVRPVRVWAPTQSPNETRQYVAEALGAEKADVECRVTLLGGGFGRKSKPDYVCEAAILSKKVGAPVRVQWTREDEIKHGYYHAASAQYLKAGLDSSGKVTAWHHSGAWPSLLSLWNPAQKTGSEAEYGLGLIDLPYNSVPNIRIENGEADVMIRVGWYRAVNNIQHAFATNGFANELAAAAGRDPVELMLELVGEADAMDLSEDGVEEIWNYGDSVEDWPIMPKRLSNTLRVVAEKAGYGKKLPEGHGLGLACHRSFHSYVATAVRVVVHDDGTYRIPQVDTAIDCGRYVNPEGVRKQIEGAAVYGNTLARHGRITTTKGAVDQSNFHDYPITRMNDAPLNVRVHIVEDFVDRRPCGVGEPGVPPYAPALVNAIYDATGRRIRKLPIGNELTAA